MKIDVCRGDDLQTFYPPEEETDRTCWTIQKISKFGSSHEKFNALPRPKT